MFVKNQLIHFPDSPRQQNLAAWLGDKKVLVKNKTNKTINNRIKIDLRAVEEDIAEGIIYVQESADHLYLIYKQKPGVYTQSSFRSGTIDIPLPELYVHMSFDINRRTNHVKLSGDYVHIGSKHLALMPLTNIYSDYDSPPNKVYNDDVHWAKMCCERVLSNMAGECDNVMELVNSVATNLPTFLLSKSNDDLSIYNCRENETARNIVSEATSNNTRTDYKTYWGLLNYLMETRTPEEVYEDLKQNGRRLMRDNKAEATKRKNTIN